MAASGAAAVQDTGSNTRATGSSVALDQVSITQAEAPADVSRPSDLNISQPAPPPRSTLVTSGEISSRADSHIEGIAPVIGDDRCDAAAARTHTELCRGRLEAKADQYGRPVPAPITAEGRLLLLVNPNGTSMAADTAGRQLGTASGLNAPNGPAEQLAGALQDRKATQDAATTSGSDKSAGQGSLPPNVPTIAVIPTK